MHLPNDVKSLQDRLIRTARVYGNPVVRAQVERLVMKLTEMAWRAGYAAHREDTGQRNVVLPPPTPRNTSERPPAPPTGHRLAGAIDNDYAIHLCTRECHAHPAPDRR